MTRWGIWPVAGLALVGLAAIGSWTTLLLVVPAVVVFGGVLVLNRTTTKRLAKRLRAVPAASEPFTFIADPLGTASTSETGSDRVTWARYKAVTLDDDLVVLTLDTEAIRILPVAALTSGQTPSEAVAMISTWINTAQPTTTTVGP